MKNNAVYILFATISIPVGIVIVFKGKQKLGDLLLTQKLLLVQLRLPRCINFHGNSMIYNNIKGRK